MTNVPKRKSALGVDVSALPGSPADFMELRDPGQDDQHHRVEVTYNGKTRRYTATLPNVSTSEGRSLADALHGLANKLDAAKLFGSATYDPHLLGKRMKPCQYCDAPIFFAQTKNGKWMPMDGESVTATDLPDERRYVIVDTGGTPHVRSVAKPQGEVWIAHPVVCGVADEPEAPLLKERWRKNRTVMIHHNTEAVADLQQIVHDLT